jgi:hypothetical protein
MSTIGLYYTNLHEGGRARWFEYRDRFTPWSTMAWMILRHSPLQLHETMETSASSAAGQFLHWHTFRDTISGRFWSSKSVLTQNPLSRSNLRSTAYEGGALTTLPRARSLNLHSIVFSVQRSVNLNNTLLRNNSFVKVIKIKKKKKKKKININFC